MIIDNMTECGNNLVQVANALRSYLSSEDTSEPQLTEKEEPQTPKVPSKSYSMEEVRAILSAKSKAGYREQVKDLITKRGVENLTKLDPAEYASLVAEVEVLGND